MHHGATPPAVFSEQRTSVVFSDIVLDKSLLMSRLSLYRSHSNPHAQHMTLSSVQELLKSYNSEESYQSLLPSS